MPQMNPFLIVAAILVIVLMVAAAVLRRFLDSSLEHLLAINQYDTAIQVLDKRLTRILFSTLKQYYLRFSIYQAAKKPQLARKMLDHLLGMRVSSRRRLVLVAIAFNFYIEQKDKHAAREMLEEIERSGNKQLIEDCRAAYEIVFQKDSSRIEEMEAMLSEASPQMRQKLYHLLALQYQNRGNKKEARRYEQLASQKASH